MATTTTNNKEEAKARKSLLLPTTRYSTTLARSLGTWLPTAGARTRRYLHYCSYCSGTPSQPQCFDLNNTTLGQRRQPVACVPRDQLPAYNNKGQCTSGSYVQFDTAPYSRAPSATSYISTPGPIVHHINHIGDNRGDCYNSTTVPTTCDDIN